MFLCHPCKTPQKSHRNKKPTSWPKLRTAWSLRISAIPKVKYTRKIEDPKKTSQMSVGSWKKQLSLWVFFCVFSGRCCGSHFGETVFSWLVTHEQHANLPPISSGQSLPRWNSCWDNLAKSPCRQNSIAAKILICCKEVKYKPTSNPFCFLKPGKLFHQLQKYDKSEVKRVRMNQMLKQRITS